MSQNIALLKSYAGWYRFYSIICYIFAGLMILGGLALIVTIIVPIVYGLLAYYLIWQGQKYGKCAADLAAITEENYHANTESLALLQAQVVKMQGIVSIAALAIGLISSIMAITFGASLLHNTDFQNMMKSAQSSYSSEMNSSMMSSSNSSSSSEMMMPSSSSSLFSTPAESN